VCAKSLAASESTVGQVNGLGIRTSSLVPFALSQSIQAPKSNPPTALPFKCPCAPAEGLSFPIFVALVRPAPATTAMRFCLSANQQPASDCGRKPSSDSPPLHRPWSRCKRGRNSVPTTRTDMSNVTSRGNYISSSYGADRPCVRAFEFLRHHHHRHHPPRARTLCGLYLSAARAMRCDFSTHDRASPICVC
jgi:hypothetical protein